MSKQRLKTGVGNLIVVHRDVRIIDTTTPFRCPEGEINRACAFAHSVLRRHSYTSSRGWHRLEHVFRLLRYVWNTVSKHHHSSLGVNRYFAARLNIRRDVIIRPLNIRRDSIIRPMNRTETSPKYLSNNRLQNINNGFPLNNRVHRLDPSRQDRTDLRVTCVERLVQRVVKRSTRMEKNTFHRTAERTLVSPKTEDVKPASPVPRRAPRSAAEMSSNPRASSQEISDFLEASNRSMMPAKRADTERIASVNVDQLTEQVVRAIDQRIIAQRQRQGRI